MFGVPTCLGEWVCGAGCVCVGVEGVLESPIADIQITEFSLQTNASSFLTVHDAGNDVSYRWKQRR